MAASAFTPELAMASAARIPRYTPEQYLALERKAEFKSEYYDGFITAMAGASRPHILITGNLSRKIGNQLENRPCETYSNDMRVLVSGSGLYTYPDLIVVCGEPRFLDNMSDTLLNPTVIVEVLSPTTESYDRGKKFSHYRRLESLKEYVLVAQDEVFVERYLRQGDIWQLSDWTSMDETLSLASIDCHVPLREIYTRIEFPDAPQTVGGAVPR
jgi:Uma2 family endonuclease